MARKYSTILFDLDGTLTDSKLGITRSVQYSLKYFDIIEENLDDLDRFIGPPLKESFQDFYGFDEIKAVKAVEKYREYFSCKGMFENLVYPQIPELLEQLSRAGKKLIVATSKPSVFAEKILEHFGLHKHFEFIVGSNLDGSRTRKGEVISCVLNMLDAKDLEDIVMVGDRKHDIIGANEVGIDSIGVLYGYGSITELEQARPTHMVNSVDALRDLLL